MRVVLDGTRHQNRFSVVTWPKHDPWGAPAASAAASRLVHVIAQSSGGHLCVYQSSKGPKEVTQTVACRQASETMFLLHTASIHCRKMVARRYFLVCSVNLPLYT